LGYYFIETKEEKFKKEMYSPFLAAEGGSLSLGEAQEKQPTGLRKIVGFN
jgi:hypothetical protein